MNMDFNKRQFVCSRILRSMPKQTLRKAPPPPPLQKKQQQNKTKQQQQQQTNKKTNNNKQTNKKDNKPTVNCAFQAVRRTELQQIPPKARGTW